jgi:uncharacterized protein
MKTRYSIITIFLVLFLSGTGTLIAQDLPDKQNPPRLVNDFAGLLNSQEMNALEQKLVAFNDSTSTQIAIVIVRSLGGSDKSEYASRLGDKWGVGQKGKNNGILILLKPKTMESSGEVFIATGYGAEGAVPDLICSDIVNNEMLPSFRQNDYYAGLDRATNTIMSLIRGEFTADQYSKGHSRSGLAKKAPFGALIIIIIFIIMMISSGKNNHNNISRSGLPFWILLGMMNSGRGSGGSWGGFSGGGGGGGGFGGFGGGGFGGGGAGGSW